MSELDFDFHITTPRLYISHLNPADDAHCDLTVALMHSPASVKYNPKGPVLIPDREAARAFLTERDGRMLRTSYGRYLISLRRDSESSDATPFSQRRDLEHIGVVSMQLARDSANPGPLIPDVGFSTLPVYHGKGYATEAATHLMQWFREQKGTTAFAGLTSPVNVEAQGVFKKMGMRCWGLRRVNGIGPGRDMDVSVWTIGVEDQSALEGLRL